MCRYIDQIQLQHNCFSHVLGKAYQMILQSLLQKDHQKSVINTSLRSMSLQYRWSKVMKPTLLRNIFLILTFQEKKKKNPSSIMLSAKISKNVTLQESAEEMGQAKYTVQPFQQPGKFRYFCFVLQKSNGLTYLKVLPERPRSSICQMLSFPPNVNCLTASHTECFMDTIKNHNQSQCKLLKNPQFSFQTKPTSLTGTIALSRALVSVQWEQIHCTFFVQHFEVNQ